MKISTTIVESNLPHLFKHSEITNLPGVYQEFNVRNGELNYKVVGNKYAVLENGDVYFLWRSGPELTTIKDIAKNDSSSYKCIREGDSPKIPSAIDILKPYCDK